MKKHFVKRAAIAALAAVLLCVPLSSWAADGSDATGLAATSVAALDNDGAQAPVAAFTKQQVDMKMSSATGQIIPNGNYIISTASDAQKLVAAPNKKDNAQIKVAAQKNSKLQVWKFTYISASSSYEITNVANKKDLTIDGNKIVQRKAVSRGASGFQKQRWLVTATSKGYVIQSLANKNAYLTIANTKVKAASKRSGSKAKTQRCWLFNANKWKTSNVVKSGAYTIKSAAGDVFMQPKDNKVTEGVRSVVEAKVNKNRAQIYSIELHKKGLYKILNVGTTRALTADASKFKVVEKKFIGSPAQLWKASLNDDGTVTFINKSTGKVLDISSGEAIEGKYVVQSVRTDSETQKWELNPTITGYNVMQTEALKRVSNLKSVTDYSIAIDLTRHYLMLFKHDKETDTAWELDDSWRVSNGMNKATVEWVGTKYRFYQTNPEYKGYSAYYWSGMGHAQYMHSIIYYPGTYTVQDGALGRSNSSGCVRMSLSNAKRVYYEIPNGTRVQRYY